MTLLLSITAAAAPAPAKKVLVFGDSLSAGYGIAIEDAWPSLLDKRLKERGLNYSVANLSISGETSAGGKARFAAALSAQKPAIVLIELGANDGLRGLPLKLLRDNLESMISSAQKAKAQVVLIGMRLPPNYGPYGEQFNQVFGDIAKARKLPLVKFLFEGIAGKPEMFQADQLHPTAAAQPQLLDNVWPNLAPLLNTP